MDINQYNEKKRVIEQELHNLDRMFALSNNPVGIGTTVKSMTGHIYTVTKIDIIDGTWTNYGVPLCIYYGNEGKIGFRQDQIIEINGTSYEYKPLE